MAVVAVAVTACTGPLRLPVARGAAAGVPDPPARPAAHRRTPQPQPQSVVPHTAQELPAVLLLALRG